MFLLLVSCTGHSAVTSDKSQSQEILECVQELRILSNEQVALLLSTLSEISYGQALQSIELDAAQGITFQRVSIAYALGEASDGTVYAPWMINIHAVIKVAVDVAGESYFLDSDVVCCWNEIAQLDEAVWLEIYSPMAAVTQKDAVLLSTRGSLIVAQSEQLSQDILENKLGFEKTYSMDGIQYYRKTQTISDTYTDKRT